MDAKKSLVREAVGVFEDATAFQNAVDELLISGFNRAEISLLASEYSVTEKLGHSFRKVESLEDDAQVPRAAYISPEAIGGAQAAVIGTLLYVGAVTAAGAVLASGGTLAAAFAAEALAGGGVTAVGTVLARRIGQHHADHVQTQLNHGGLILWVNIRDAEHEKRAIEILTRYSAHDVHVHDIA